MPRRKTFSLSDWDYMPVRIGNRNRAPRRQNERHARNLQILADWLEVAKVVPQIGEARAEQLHAACIAGVRALNGDRHRGHRHGC